MKTEVERLQSKIKSLVNDNEWLRENLAKAEQENRLLQVRNVSLVEKCEIIIKSNENTQKLLESITVLTGIETDSKQKRDSKMDEYQRELLVKFLSNEQEELLRLYDEATQGSLTELKKIVAFLKQIKILSDNENI